MGETLLIPVSKDDLINLISEAICKASKSELHIEQREGQDEIFDISGAAEFLFLKVPTVYSKVNKGEIPHMKKGNRLYFSKRELLNYLKQGRNQTYREAELKASEYISKHS